MALPLSLRKSAIVLIGKKPASEPHHFHITTRLALKPAARLNPIEVAVDVELQQYRRMIRRPTGRLRVDPAKPKIAQIEFVNKDVDHTNGIIRDYPIFQAVQKQRALPPINPFNEALHPIPRNPQGIIPRESPQARRFHTARVNLGPPALCEACPQSPSNQISENWPAISQKCHNPPFPMQMYSRCGCSPTRTSRYR
jgi:hypothetical protein